MWDFNCVTPPGTGHKIQYMACTPRRMGIQQHIAERIGPLWNRPHTQLMEQHLHSQEVRASSAQPAGGPSYRPCKPLRAAPQRADPNPGRKCLVSQFCVHRNFVLQNQHILTTSLDFTSTGAGHKIQRPGDPRGLP